MSMELTLWGVRGSTPCANTSYALYGGHTSCISVEVDNEWLVFDAGSGIHDAGQYALNQNIAQTHLFMTHVHLDHVLGLPFYLPIWKPSHRIQIYAGYLSSVGGAKAFFENTFSPPLFPVPFASLADRMKYRDLQESETLGIGSDVEIRTHGLNHPSHATGYRITHRGKSICYITDNEHTIGQIDKQLVDFIRDSDVFIYDSTYVDENMESMKLRGHSTWQEGMRLGQLGNVKQFLIFHHDPQHDDQAMSVIEEKARLAWDRCVVARQGMRIAL